MKEGGEVAGRGSYGIVYVNPRPNCRGEKNRKRNDQAGKVFYKKDEQNHYQGRKHALEEMQSVQQIRKRFAHSMKTIKKYAILPEKKCLIQHSQLPKDPRWYTDKKRTVYPEVKDPAVTEMIVYEKANSTAEEAFQKIRTKEEFMEYVSMMNQLEKGIRLLHQHELYHNDIKGDNIVLVTENATRKSFVETNSVKVLKLIDFGFLLQGADNPEFDDMAVRLDYQPYPPSVMSLTDIENPETREYILNKIEYSSHSSRFESIYKNLYEPFHKHESSFTPKMKQQMEKMCKTLMTEKGVGFTGFYEWAKQCPTKNEWETGFPKVMDQFVNYLKETVDTNPYFKKSLLSRKELCEKVNLYSFGIVFLHVLTKAPITMNEKQLLPLYKKVFALCHVELKPSSAKRTRKNVLSIMK